MLKFEGINDISKKINRTNLDDVKAVVRQCTGIMENKAKRIVPVGTPESTGIKGYRGGTLKRSITSRIKDKGLTGETTPYTDYDIYVELGTRKMRARPFMRPAFLYASKEFKKRLKKLVK